MTKMSKYIGSTINKLTILDVLHKKTGNRSRWHFVCKCECGSNTTVLCDKILSNKTVSCGCFGIEKRVESIRKHGMSNSKIYKVWLVMMQRCVNKNNPSYHNYGGRGVEVCESWLASFENFYEDMKEGYVEGVELDRINNDAGYFPENCRWVTKSNNCKNRRGLTNSSSKFKGVYWHKKANKWCASITNNGDRIYLGVFEDEVDAAKVYNKACLRYHGEYAHLNDINEI